MKSGQSFRRTLVVLWLCQFFVMAGMSSAVPFLPLFIRELGVNGEHNVAVWSGWVFAAPFLVAFFLTPVWGALGDRYGRKLMTARAIIGLSVSLVLIGISQNVEQLFFFRVLQGILSGFYPAALALAAAEAPEEKTSFALSTIQSANVSGNIIGPLFGGSISVLIGYRWVFVGSGILTGFLAVLLIYFVHERNRIAERKSISIVENYRFLFKQSQLLIYCLLMLLAAFAESLLRPVFVLFVESFNPHSGRAALYTGVILSLHGFTAAVSALFIGRRIRSNTIVKILTIALAGTGIINILQGASTAVAYLFPARLMLGMFYGLVFPALFYGIASGTPMERKSGIMGIASSFQTLGNFFGPMTAGYLAGFLGLAGVFHFSGLWFVGLAALCLFPKKK